MCIALPRRIMAVVDRDRMLVAVACEVESSKEIVSAVLVVTPDLPVEQLIGAFVLIHAGFAIALIDEAEARSRMQVFAALGGDDGEIDLDDFYIATTGVVRTPELQESSGASADFAAPSNLQVLRHV